MSMEAREMINESAGRPRGPDGGVARGVGDAPPLMRLIERPYPLCRSITGDAVRQTLDILKESIPLERPQVATGTQVLDWEIPREWNIIR